MGSDVSRVRFNPLRHFAGVVQQQGRLVLDADWNESVAILDRRLRAQMVDVASSGPDADSSGVAWVPRQTPDAFAIQISGGGLTIGRGRMYVDGLLAENHGGPPMAWDPLLAEQTGTTDTPYAAQPYWPTPEELPSSGRHLAFLDVWQREVTHLEDPGLIETAVGVDTTARVQTAWRVRLLRDVGQISCSTADKDIPGWLAALAPSAGRLTTGTVEVDPEEDPCELPPTGGYRGLENQTYRVEIHEEGAPGTATFKWSRDNGSVAMPVVEMLSPALLRLASVGKDDVLRVSTGDWVEILDDHYELAGRPGAIRKVTVDDAARTITFTGGIDSDLQPADTADLEARHLRVRRWDQSGIVRDTNGTSLADLDAPGSAGVVKVPTSGATSVVLENGVTIRFSMAAGGSGKFRSGDYWVFAARLADTSLETLVAAPPMGTHHHFARLGSVDLAAGTVTDCRRQWPPAAEAGEGCCTVSVGDGTTSDGEFAQIQAAVDHVAGLGGGRVCVLPGDHRLDAPVTIESDDIVVAGCGMMSRISAAEGEPAFVIRNARRVTVETLMALSTSRDATIRVLVSSEVEIRDCAVGNSVDRGPFSEPRVSEFERAGRSAQREPLGPAVAVSELEGRGCERFTVENSVAFGLPAVSVQAHEATVRGNRLHGGGTWLSDGARDVAIADNQIAFGIGPGVLLGGLLLDELPGAIDGGVARVSISGNRISRMTASGITTWGHFREPQSVLDKRRTGFGSLVNTLSVKDNRIRECANAETATLFDPEALGGIILREVTVLSLADNEIADNGAAGNQPACGVFLHACVGVDLHGNRITGNAPAPDADAAMGERYQGGVVAPLVTAFYDDVGEFGDGRMEDFEIRVPEREQWGSPTHALRLDGNTIVSPRGHALLVQAVGSVSIADSLLAGYDVAEQPKSRMRVEETLARMGAFVRIVNLGVALDGAERRTMLGQGQGMLLRNGLPLDGRVLFHGNQLQFQIPDGSPFFEQLRERGLAAAVGLLSNDDVSFQDNQVMLYARPTLG